jgi:predicted RNase H-like HicB family nuclease
MMKEIALTLEIEREGDQYVATCRELDVSSYGDTVEDAIEHVRNALLLYLDVIEQDGEREQVFRERGIQIVERLDADYKTTVHPGVLTTALRVPVAVG